MERSIEILEVFISAPFLPHMAETRGPASDKQKQIIALDLFAWVSAGWVHEGFPLSVKSAVCRTIEAV